MIICGWIEHVAYLMWCQLTHSLLKPCFHPPTAVVLERCSVTLHLCKMLWPDLTKDFSLNSFSEVNVWFLLPAGKENPWGRRGSESEMDWVLSCTNRHFTVWADLEGQNKTCHKTTFPQTSVCFSEKQGQPQKEHGGFPLMLWANKVPDLPLKMWSVWLDHHDGRQRRVSGTV